MLPLPPGGFPHLLVLAAIAGLTCGLAALDRKGALQLMVSRPIALAPLLGALLGDAHGGLFIGIPLELLFLGGVNLGGSLPENETLFAGALTAALVPAGLAGGGVDASLGALGIALFFPVAMMGRRLERVAEERNAGLLAVVEQRVAGDDAAAVRLNLRGLWFPFFTAALFGSLCTLLSPLLALARQQLPAAPLASAWFGVVALACAAAIRAIRDPRAPFFAALTAALAVGAALYVGILS